MRLKGSQLLGQHFSQHNTPPPMQQNPQRPILKTNKKQILPIVQFMLGFPLSPLGVVGCAHWRQCWGVDRRVPGGHFSHLPCSAFPESSSIIVIWVFHVMGGRRWSRHKPHYGEKAKPHILTKKHVGKTQRGQRVLEIIWFAYLPYGGGIYGSREPRNLLGVQSIQWQSSYLTTDLLPCSRLLLCRTLLSYYSIVC